MSREAELIKEIDEHLRREGHCGKLCIYGLELPGSDLQVIRTALIEKKIRKSRIEAGDVVTDYGYHGQVVITRIEKCGYFEGYYVADGVTVKGLEIKDFVKIADKSGEWKSSRNGAYFQRKGGNPPSEE